MSGVGEMIVSAVVKQIAGKLGDLAAGEVALQWGFKDDALKLAGKMEDLEAVMHDADNKLRQGGSSGEAVERWLTKLSSVAYDAEDVLDELAATELIKKIQPKLKLFFSRNNQLYQRITVPHKIKNLRKRIEEIEKDGQILNLVRHEPRVEGSRNDETFAATSDEGMKTLMVGRGTEVDKIINLLLKSEDNEHISIIPIVGLGGIGKTTLAQSVFADNRVKVFDVKVWVHVSKEFDLIKIGSSIIKSINSNINLDNCTLQFLRDNLRNELATKRYMIVLDDLWEEDWSELDKLKLMLPHDCKGSKVIVTTRNQSVVESLNNECTDQINLDVLSPNDCWIVMKQRAFKPGDNHSDTLEKIGREIAGKCGGLPLVAKALGHVMSQLRTVEAWQAIRETQNVQETTLERLMVSYNFMKLEFKMCFTYLAAFPKGFVVDSDRLIQQWIALGYIPSRFNGQICINYLLGMSFLEISRPSSVSPSLAQAKRQELTMHDLVHDLATKVMGNEFLVLDATKPSPPRAKSSNCRHAQLINYHNQSKVFKHLPSKVRSLHFRNNSTKLPLPNKAFSRSKYIRVLNLDLSGCSVESEPTPNNKVSPSSILKLKLLKYLDATGLPFASLPKSIHTLQNLQSLILSNSSLQTLPDLICSLHKLCYLDLSGSSSLVTLPASLEEITELSFLNLSRCSILKQLPQSICNITCLQHLDLSKCCVLQHLPDNFGSLPNLLFLNLSGCSELTKLPDSFGSLAHLLLLNLSGCSKLTKLPDCVNLESLEHLNISSCHELENLPQDFGNLQNLVFLNLSECYKISVLPESFCKLIHLKYLDLSDCHNLTELPGCFGNLSELETLILASCCKLKLLPESFCRLFKLRHLNLSFCMRLEKLPSLLGDLKLEFLDISDATFHDLPDSIYSMTTLTQLEVSSAQRKVFDKARDIRKHLNLVEGIIHRVHQIDNKGCSSIVEVAHLTCQELEVSELQNVKHPEDAERARLRDKSDLQTLHLSWEHEGEEDISVLERLVPPRTLERFYLNDYMSKDFPNWMSHISTYLPSLTLLSLENLTTCDNLPPFGKLPNLRCLFMENIPNITRIGKEFYGEGGTCRKLRLINLESMENLVEWWTTQSGEENEESLIPNLHKLEIINCPKLKFLPYPPRSMIWHLGNSSMVLPKGGFGKLSSSVLPFQMVVYNCNFAPDKWDRLQHLPTLEIFEVNSCNGLRALPEAFRCLTSVREVQLRSLKDLEILPEWLGNHTSLEDISIIDCPLVTSLPASMKCLIALRELWLQQCEGLDVLPEWLGQLVSLQEFNITDCPLVTYLPESMKNLTSLRFLWLKECKGLEVLPEGLGQLVSLQEFNIIDCPNLTRLPESIQNLTKLEELYIWGCPSLVERCQGEDAHRIYHIPKVILNDVPWSTPGRMRDEVEVKTATWIAEMEKLKELTKNDSCSDAEPCSDSEDAGASSCGDDGEWTYGDAGASTSGDAGESISEGAGPSTY